MFNKKERFVLYIYFVFFCFFIFCSFMMYQKLSYIKIADTDKTKLIAVSKNIIFEPTERELFACYHFRRPVNENIISKIKKNDMINGSTLVTKSTIHVYKNAFYSWEEINKLIIDNYKLEE